MSRSNALTLPLICLAITLLLTACGRNEPQPVSPAPTPVMTTPAHLTISEDEADYILSVTGMHCDGCASGLTQEWAGLPGVEQCQVSFAEGKAYFKLAPNTDTDALQTALIALAPENYQIALLKDQSAEPQPAASEPADNSDEAPSTTE